MDRAGPKDDKATGLQHSPPPKHRQYGKSQGRVLETINEGLPLQVNQEPKASASRSPSSKERKVETREFLKPEKGRLLIRHRNLDEVIALMSPVPLPQQGYLEPEVINDRREAIFKVISMAAGIQTLQKKGKDSKVSSSKLISKAEISNLLIKRSYSACKSKLDFWQICANFIVVPCW